MVVTHQRSKKSGGSTRQSLRAILLYTFDATQNNERDRVICQDNAVAVELVQHIPTRAREDGYTVVGTKWC